MKTILIDKDDTTPCPFRDVMHDICNLHETLNNPKGDNRKFLDCYCGDGIPSKCPLLFTDKVVVVLSGQTLIPFTDTVLTF